MNKTLRLYIAIFILAVIAMLYYQESKPKPINWSSSYTKKHKIPYGNYILYEELQSLFPNSKIEDIDIPPYLFLKDNQKKGSYIFIDININFGDDEFNKLLEFVKKGNDVFLSTKGCKIDTLGLKTKRIFSKSSSDEPYFKLYNPIFKNKEYSFDREFINIVFTEIDTTKTVVLGQSGFVDEFGKRTGQGVNFIKQPFGAGNFYFHTYPEAFTNYQILQSPNNKYASAVLSYLGEPTTLFWDNYHKSGKNTITSPMHYILSSKSLKWAYYFMLIAVLFFVLFEGKRKQRSIPIIKPLKNQSLAFSRTIANMYYEKKEHKNIAEQQIQYLLEYIRIKLRVPTIHIDRNFYNTLAARSGKTEESVEKLFKYIDFIHQKNQITQTSLEQLNTHIENFKTES